jgi:hypothetical protein
MTSTWGPWIFVDLFEMQAFQLTAMSDALTLSFKAKAAVGLFVGADAEVTVGGAHARILPCW